MIEVIINQKTKEILAEILHKFQVKEAKHDMIYLTMRSRQLPNVANFLENKGYNPHNLLTF